MRKMEQGDMVELKRQLGRPYNGPAGSLRVRVAKRDS